MVLIIDSENLYSVFYDWLKAYQDFSEKHRLLDDVIVVTRNESTGEIIDERQPKFKHKGSYSTEISVTIANGRIMMDGNPSRFNRPDNLFGFDSIDKCFYVYNKILKALINFKWVNNFH